MPGPTLDPLPVLAPLPSPPRSGCRRSPRRTRARRRARAGRPPSAHPAEYDPRAPRKRSSLSPGGEPPHVARQRLALTPALSRKGEREVEIRSPRPAQRGEGQGEGAPLRRSPVDRPPRPPGSYAPDVRRQGARARLPRPRAACTGAVGVEFGRGPPERRRGAARPAVPSLRMTRARPADRPAARGRTRAAAAVAGDRRDRRRRRGRRGSTGAAGVTGAAGWRRRGGGSRGARRRAGRRRRGAERRRRAWRGGSAGGARAAAAAPPARPAPRARRGAAGTSGDPAG